MARILIIDDDDLLRGVLVQAVTHAGHEVVQAADGKIGIELVRAEAVDLVVTDMIMPGQEGVQTISILRREWPHIPVIAMSGGLSHSNLYLDIARKIGARRILPKPFTPRELLDTIDEVLSGAEGLQDDAK